ncbi:LysM peptidoglycan-binding domain-containing protein [Bacillus sp. 31A1R]|uniref:Autolysin n=1 Tax=Robertmurraya mangrovi TaxID=3098077 RepID=A0ABU5ITY2_9BACI|nr:LysM peptidoglycan-binding domain-containing protein [Bacillus sp. 31A1R]MDZ5470566.1 LysM peptidoglycan-binding domain-containing protein [Bacillus sp. 31A1R]
MKKISVLILSFILLVIMNISPSKASGYNHSNLYDVKPGDTLWKIASKYHTSIEDLKVTNGLQSDLLLTGQKLWVPTTYVVVSGDTLWKISNAYNSSVQLIKAANGLKSDYIYIGQRLKIPQRKLNMQGQYVLMTREEFKDWLFHHKFNRDIRLIQQHHTWQPAYNDFKGTNYFTMLKGMENFHVQEMKWKNIAQNLTTFPDGKIAVSRPFNMEPEGSIGPKANAGAIMIENIGNFDIGHDVMTKEQKETIVYMTALLSLKFGLTPSIDTITYHHWWDLNTKERVLDNSKGYSVKTCPGTGFFGGNSTTAAKTYFYPQVKRKMQEITASLQ